MLTYHDFQEITLIQATVFTPNLIFATGEIFKKLLDLKQDLFDGDPMVLPLPNEAPKDIPRITVKNKKRTYKLEVAPARINFFRYKTDNKDQMIPKQFMQTATEILSELLISINAHCGRIAVVIDRISVRDDFPSKEIAKHFCKENFLEAPFDRPSEFEIHALKKYNFLERFNVNSWVRVRTGHIQNERGVKKDVINIQQDINTLAEETKSYSKEDLFLFFNNVYDELNIILKLYFPNNKE